MMKLMEELNASRALVTVFPRRRTLTSAWLRSDVNSMTAIALRSPRCFRPARRRLGVGRSAQSEMFPSSAPAAWGRRSAQSEVGQLTDDEHAHDDHQRQGDVGRPASPLTTMTLRRLP